MTLALSRFTTSEWVLLLVAGVVLVSISAAYIGRVLTRRGMREPLVVRMINRTSERFVATIKRPITVAVLDEVAQVLQAGNYTRNMAAALHENHAQIRQMITEKVMSDPATGKSIGLLPFHERLVEEITEAGLRVVFEVLSDPRTDELVSDLLRDNLTQLRHAVSALDS
jgi:hypothetical protein